MRSKKNTLTGVPNLIFRSHLDLMFFTHVTTAKEIARVQGKAYKFNDLMKSFRAIYGFTESELPDTRLVTAFQRTHKDFRDINKTV